MNKSAIKIMRGLIIIIVLLGAVFAIWKLQSNNTEPAQIPPDGYLWNEYENKELGFVIAYPSDIAHPREMPQLPNPDGTFLGADNIRFYDTEYQIYISLWIQDTNTRNVDDWFEEVYGSNGGVHYISARSTVGGVPAINVGESESITIDPYDHTFIHNGRVWTLIIDNYRLSSEAVGYILQSFRFLN